MSALSELKDLATRQSAAIQGVRGDIARLKEIIANNPDGINAEGVEELRTLFTANATELEALDAENPEPTPGEGEPQG